MAVAFCPAKPKVFFKAGYWWCGLYAASTIPELIALVRDYATPTPSNPIFRYGA